MTALTDLKTRLSKADSVALMDTTETYADILREVVDGERCDCAEDDPDCTGWFIKPNPRLLDALCGEFQGLEDICQTEYGQWVFDKNYTYVLWHYSTDPSASAVLLDAMPYWAIDKIDSDYDLSKIVYDVYCRPVEIAHTNLHTAIAIAFCLCKLGESNA